MNFVLEITEDLNWRASQLAILKSLPYKYNMMSHHSETIVKYSVPAVYALWEGFVKKCFELYANQINLLEIPISDVHLNVLTHTICSYDKLILDNPRKTFEKKKEFVEAYHNTICQPLKINIKIPTRSNIDLAVINEILTRFNLRNLPQKHSRSLNKILHYRNSIAHGEDSLPVDKVLINTFATTISELMYEVLFSIMDGYEKKSYLK